MATLTRVVDLPHELAFEALLMFGSKQEESREPRHLLSFESALAVEIIGATVAYLHGAEEGARVPSLRDTGRHWPWQKTCNALMHEAMEKKSENPLAPEVRRALRELTHFYVYCNGSQRRFQTAIRNLLKDSPAYNPAYSTFTVSPIIRRTESRLVQLPTEISQQLEAIGCAMRLLIERDLHHFQRGTRS